MSNYFELRIDDRTIRDLPLIFFDDFEMAIKGLLQKGILREVVHFHDIANMQTVIKFYPVLDQTCQDEILALLRSGNE